MMKFVLTLISVLFLNCTLVQADNHLQSDPVRFQRFKEYVTEAIKLLEVPENLTIYVGELDVEWEAKVMAATTLYYQGNDPTIYAVRISSLVVVEGEDYLLQLIALHEVCHIKNGDLLKVLAVVESEYAAERCVRDILGQEKYNQGLEYLEKEQFKNPELQLLHKYVIATSKIIAAR